MLTILRKQFHFVFVLFCKMCKIWAEIIFRDLNGYGMHLLELVRQRGKRKEVRLIGVLWLFCIFVGKEREKKKKILSHIERKT